MSSILLEGVKQSLRKLFLFCYSTWCIYWSITQTICPKQTWTRRGMMAFTEKLCFLSSLIERFFALSFATSAIYLSAPIWRQKMTVFQKGTFLWLKVRRRTSSRASTNDYTFFSSDFLHGNHIWPSFFKGLDD